MTSNFSRTVISKKAKNSWVTLQIEDFRLKIWEGMGLGAQSQKTISKTSQDCQSA
jgi:hypothetical protein